MPIARAPIPRRAPGIAGITVSERELPYPTERAGDRSVDGHAVQAGGLRRVAGAVVSLATFTDAPWCTDRRVLGKAPASPVVPDAEVTATGDWPTSAGLRFRSSRKDSVGVLGLDVKSVLGGTLPE